MSSRGHAFVLAAALACAAGSAALAAPPDPLGGTGGDPLAGTLTVTVVEDGSGVPLAGAFVMVGQADGVPFAGNVGFTDGSGQIVFSDPALVATATVTAGAAGRAYTTVFALGVSEAVLSLPPIASAGTARIGDQFAGIEVNNGVLCLGDGNLDVGFVMPAIRLADLVGDPVSILARLFSPVSEPMSTPLGAVDVPSNLFLPLQCELLGYYSKLGYHLRVPTGESTIHGLSVRASLSSLLAVFGGELDLPALIELMNQVAFNEVGVLRDVDITGDSDAVDLTADRPLSGNLTVTIENAQPLTTVFAAAGGQLTAADGGQELIVTGARGFDPDVEGPTAMRTLSTAQASGPLVDLVHGLLVVQLQDTGELFGGGFTTSLRRSGITPPAAVTVGSFYDIVGVSTADGVTFSWTDVGSPTSPATRDLGRSRIAYNTPVAHPDDPTVTVTDTSTYWVLYERGTDQDLTLPTLPPSAPTAIPDPGATAAQDTLVFAQEVHHLGDDPDGFDYDAFALADPARYATELTSNSVTLPCGSTTEVAGVLATKGPGPGQVTLVWSPSPDVCHDALTRGYGVYLTDDPVPAADPGAWPTDPSFVEVTGDDLDGNPANEFYAHVPPSTSAYYLVVDGATNGTDGPAGHY